MWSETSLVTQSQDVLLWSKPGANDTALFKVPPTARSPRPDLEGGLRSGGCGTRTGGVVLGFLHRRGRESSVNEKFR